MNNGQITVVGIDKTTLPEELLDDAKTQMRVQFDRDDQYIIQAIGRAINLYEQFIGRSLFVRSIEWRPLPYPTIQPAPYQPVIDMTVTGSDGTDLSADYMVFDRSGSSWVGAKAGIMTAFPDGSLIRLETGVEDKDSMPLGALDIVLRITAGLYENREHQTTVNMEMVSFWLQDLIVGGGWIPRA